MTSVCPVCGYAYVRNVGEKKFYYEEKKKGDEVLERKRRCTNEKKYLCRKCGWHT